MKKDKIFCIGLFKTGTTSLELTLKEFGFTLGDQSKGELLIKDWHNDIYENIFNLCESASAFQDIPFGLPNTYKFLSKKYPNSKFILSVRDDEEQWYNSLIKFHTRLWSTNFDGPPSSKDLKNARYRYKGWAYETMKLIFDTSDEDIYNKEILMQTYLQHNLDVINFFKFEKERILTINLSNDKNFSLLCSFLGVESKRLTFPWLNKS